MNKLKISFDFDYTLSKKPMQELCKKLLILGAEIHVVTTRINAIDGKPTNNTDLFEVTDKLGIDRNNITFTGYEDKFTFVKDFDMHFDDNFEEIFLINQHPSNCIGFLYEEKPENGIIEY